VFGDICVAARCGVSMQTSC